MKILRTIGTLAIVAALVIVGTGSAFAKNPPGESQGGGNNAHGKHGLFGTVTSVTFDGDGYVIELDTKPGVDVIINGNTKYKAPGQTKGWITEVEDFVNMILDEDIENIEGMRIAVLVQFTDESTADALRLMLIKITPPLHAHRVGTVTAFTPYTEPLLEGNGSDGNGEEPGIEILDNHGVSHIFGIDNETVYHPDGTDDTDIELGKVVTVVTTGDPKNPDNDVAKAIVLHDDLPDWGWGKIIVDKVTEPIGSLVDFEFAPSWASNFFLADEDTPEDSGWLTPGSYSVSEIVPADWTLTSAVTDDDDGTDPASITLDPGEIVTVTFTNQE